MDFPADLLFTAILFAVGGPAFVEVIGYAWHRGAEHGGWMGQAIRHRHWVHHEQEYPTDNLRPKHVTAYRSAGSWSWYLLAAVTISLAFLLLPLRIAGSLTLGGGLYAWFVVNYLHKAFHLDGHWLNRFGWFRNLVRLHDIHHWAACNYGILFFGMDRLFKTLREEFPAQKEILFPGLKGG